MRIRLVFLLRNKGGTLPFHHQNHIYKMLQQVVGEDALRANPQFNFSGLKGQTKVGKDGLHYFSKRVTLVISGLNESFCKHIIDRIFAHEEISLGSLALEPELVEQETLPPPTDQARRYLCISPLVVLNTPQSVRNKDFIHPSSDEFSDLLYECTMERMERSGEYTHEELSAFFRFQVVPDRAYLEKILAEEKKFARIYTVEEEGIVREVRGYTFPFELYASPEVHKFVLDHGFGEFCPHGFGMLDIVSELPPHREIIFEKVNRKFPMRQRVSVER